jgi:thioredoxin 1
MAPILERVAAAYEGSVDFAKVDTQSNPGIARDFNVRSIPTLLVLYQGRVVDVSVGLTSAEALHRMIRRALDQHEGVGLLAKLRRLWG